MSNNPNFVSELVQMARAFEELPIVQASLEDSRKLVSEQANTIQHLELRIIDLKNAHTEALSNIHRVEVERDHAERMFLETDDRLNAFRRLLGSFQTEAGALIAAAEPEPTAEVKVGASEVERTDTEDSRGQAFEAERIGDPLPTPEATDSIGRPQGERAVDPTTAPTANSPTSPIPEVATEASSVASAESTSTEGVSAQEVAPSVVDPTASSTAGDGHSLADVHPTDAVSETSASGQETQTSTAPSEPVDNVGYHNEPKVGVGDHAWDEWDVWCKRMNNRYGTTWPARTLVQAAH